MGTPGFDRSVTPLFLCRPSDLSHMQPGVLQQRCTYKQARQSVISMGDVSTKKPNEWKFVKGINDYGKEQTYMYLGAKDNVEEGTAPLSKPIFDLGAWSFLTRPYFILIFSPFFLVSTLLLGDFFSGRI